MSTSFKYLIAAFFLLMAMGACDNKLDELVPHNVNFEDRQFASPAGFMKATTGNYATLGGATEYSASTTLDAIWLNLAEFRGNNVRVIDAPGTNQLANARETDAFMFNNSALKDYGFAHWYWRGAYRVLLGVNLVLKHVNDDEKNEDILHAKGENLFLRAVILFDLVRLFGKPYYQDAATSPGVPLILSPITDINQRPERATVQQTYEQIISDLTAAAPLMKKEQTNSFAGKYAAYALLSRVYLYMGGSIAAPDAGLNQKAKEYADSVIMNGGYSLLQGADYVNYYTQSNQGNTETIWAINHTVATTIFAMSLQYPPQAGYTGGWARPSKNLLDLMPAPDLRRNFYKENRYPGNDTDTLACVKYGINYTAIYSNSPVHYLRLAEMYLNRAEAAAKMGDPVHALTDLNVIRTRAGLQPAVGLTGEALQLEILRQRRIELAFEGHNSFDYFRNGLPMVRNYDSFNSPALTMNAASPKVVLRVPQDEITFNANLQQNEQ